MWTFLCPGVLLLSGCAGGQEALLAPAIDIPKYSFTKGETSIRLMRGPCVEATIAAFLLQQQPGEYKDWHEMRFRFRMPDGSLKEGEGCWRELSAEQTGGKPGVQVLFNDGGYLIIDKSVFKQSGPKV